MGEHEKPTANAQTDHNDSRVYRLDDITMERISLTYPEEMREPLIWLGWYVRERCHRELDAFMQRCKALGIETDKTTWSRILRGRWNQDKEGKILPSPIMALNKFIRFVEILRKDDRVKELAGSIPFVETSTTRAIFDFIDQRRAPERVNRFGVMVGYTGTGKTASLKEYTRRNNHGLCIWVESPENGSRKEFISWLADKYGGNKSDSYESCRRRVLESVNARKTIIVDNAQKLYVSKQGTTQPAFDFLRRIQDETQCTIILSITPEFHKSLTEQMMHGYFEQFEGRAGGRKSFLVLPDFPSQEDVVAIAGAFQLQNADKHGAYLEKISRKAGRIRILFEVLQNAKIESEASGQKLTINHVKEEWGEE